MSNKEYNEAQEDPQVVEALRHFRESMHAWSEAEYSRPRLVRQSKRSTVWSMIASPLLGWSLAAVVLATTVGVPATMRYEHYRADQARAASELEQKLAAIKAEQERAAAIDDDELMSHVDSDIAQDAPDAMQPLASLMTTSKE